jgi:hypothetical protein
MDAAQARLMFQSCLEPALRDINRAASPDQAARAPCTPGLGAVGRRLGSFLGLLAIWNADAYAGLMGGHLLTGRPAAGMEDARLPHWERCVRGAGLTRVQVRMLGVRLRVCVCVCVCVTLPLVCMYLCV